MISLLEVAERAYKGPRMGEKEWSLGLFKLMQRLVSDHKLVYSGPDRFFDMDDDYADAAFRAAVDFLTEMGVYCITTSRVIRFDEDEVLTAARSAPTEVVMGEGRDTRTIRKRGTDSNRLINVISGGHCPWPQQVALATQAAYAAVPRGDMIEGFNLTNVDGYEVHGLPMAVYAARRELETMREAVRSVGRPGMAITLYPILTSAGPMVAPVDPAIGLRRTDGLLLSILPDLKVEADYIAASMFYEGYGSYRVNGGLSSTVGGFCGGIEGAMVEVTAKALAAWMVYRDSLQYEGTVSSQERLAPRWRPEMEDRSREESKIRMPLWPTYVVHRALDRNTNIIRFGGIGGRAGMGGIGSEVELLLIARDVILDTLLGCNLICTTGSNPTPYHVEYRVQVADAAVKAGIKRGEGRELVERIDGLVRERLGGQPLVDYGDRRMMVYQDFEGYFKPMKEMYDFTTQRPSKTLTENARRAGKALAEVGLDIEASAIER